MFWAAGGGAVQACAALTEEDGGLRVRDSGGDGSTPLHWAAAGVHAKRFGTGGHVDVSEPLFLLRSGLYQLRVSNIDFIRLYALVLV